MSMPLIDQRFPTRSKPPRSLAQVINRTEHREPTRQSNKPSVSAHDETTFLAKAIIIMTIIAVIPLAVMHIVLYFYPDLFMIPITPT